MKYASVKTILLAAQRNQQYGVIKTHSNTVCFSFVNGDRWELVDAYQEGCIILKPHEITITERNEIIY